MTEEISTLSCTHPTFLKIILFIFSSFIFFIFFLQCCVCFCHTTILNFIFFCLHWVVIAVHEGFLVEALVGRLHQLWPVGSVVAPPGPRAEAQQLWCTGLVAPQLGGGNFPDQGPNLCLLY